MVAPRRPDGLPQAGRREWWFADAEHCSTGANMKSSSLELPDLGTIERASSRQ
jgi:hypothetical protein